MEIGHIRPKKCYKCHKLGHIAKHCRSSHQSKGHVNTASEQQHRGDYRPRDKNYKQPRLCSNVTAQTILKGTAHNLRSRVTIWKTRLFSS